MRKRDHPHSDFDLIVGEIAVIRRIGAAYRKRRLSDKTYILKDVNLKRLGAERIEPVNKPANFLIMAPGLCLAKFYD